MNTNKMALRAAVIVALGTPAVASATLYSPGAPVVLASEILLGSTRVANFMGDYALTINMKDFAGRKIETNSPLEIKLVLTNGAEFNGVSIDSLRCNYKTDGAVGAATLVGGANGDSQATFKLAGGTLTALAAESICTFRGGIKLTSGSREGLAAYDMTVSAYLKSQANITEDEVKFTTAGTIMAFKQAYSLVVTPAPVTIDVADPSFSQKFITNSSPTGVKSAVLGSMKYRLFAAENAHYLKTDNTIGTIGDSVTEPDDLLPGNVAVTFTGLPLQAAAGATTVGVGRGANDVAACVVNATTEYKSPTASGSVTFSLTPAELVTTNGTTFCYVVDGLTKIDKGAVNFSLVPPSNSDYKPNLTVAGDQVITTVVKNGTGIKVLTIPDPKDANNELNIRIYNAGSAKVTVSGTLYSPDGKQLGKNAPLGTIEPNAVLVLKSGGPAPKNLELASKFSLTEWSTGTGRAWMQIEGDSKQIRVQILAKTNGILVNMSDRVIEEGGTFSRTQ